MHTPAAALAWELWRRHRKRVLIMIGLVLGFALVYPKLCVLAGFNLSGPNALDQIVTKFEVIRPQEISGERIFRVLCALALACGPAVVMFMTLLYVTWIFTFTALDPKTKDPLTFPVRLFTLPVSTPFLFWWLLLAGQAAVIVCYSSWVYFVPLPRLDIFAAYQNCFGWMTLLALTQGIVWALASWPITRMLVLSAMFFCFSLSPAWPENFESPLLFPLLFILGVMLARAGLQKMRHGQWQGWNWEQTFSKMTVRAELRGPKRFASPAQAQLWFEWRQFARRLCFLVAALTVAPIVIHLLARIGFDRPLQYNTMCFFTGYLVAIVFLVHILSSMSPAKTDLPFLLIRPVTNGEMLMAALKAAAISAVLSWAIVVATLCFMPLLGDFHAVKLEMFPPPPFRTITILGLVLLTWRFVAVNLCFAWSGKRRLTDLPALLFALACIGAISLLVLGQYSAFWVSFWPFVSGLLASLVAVKFLLAFLAFRVSLQRRLLAPSALIGYLLFWILLVSGLLATLLILARPSKELMLQASMAMVLLVPLARIGFCPITLSWNRHS
jgi:hypothetical protein